MSDRIVCEHCGQMGLFAGVLPHVLGNAPQRCPVKISEHEKRMEILSADLALKRIELRAREKELTRA